MKIKSQLTKQIEIANNKFSSLEGENKKNLKPKKEQLGWLLQTVGIEFDVINNYQ